MSGFQKALNRRYLLVIVLISLLAAFAVQLPALQSTLRTDSLNHNYDFLDGRGTFTGFTASYYGHATYYRPVFELLYGLESKLDFSPLLFRIVSIILACLFALLVARLTKELTQKTGLGLGAGIITSFHPLVGLMILRPINQVTLLGMVLLLISVLTFLLQLRSTTKRNKYWLLSLSLITALAAMLTKEIALPLPGVLFLIALWEALRLKATLTKAIKHSLKSILPFAIILGIYLLLRFNALGGLHLVGEQGGQGIKSLGSFLVTALWVPDLNAFSSSAAGFIEILLFGLPVIILGAILYIPSLRKKEGLNWRHLVVHPLGIILLSCIPLLVPLYGRFSQLDTLVFLPAVVMLGIILYRKLHEKKAWLAKALASITIIWYIVAGVADSLLWDQTSKTNDRLTAALEAELPAIQQAGGYILINPPAHYGDTSCLTRIYPDGVTHSLAIHLRRKAPGIGYADACRWQQADPNGENVTVTTDGKRIILRVNRGKLAPAPPGTHHSPFTPITPLEITEHEITIENPDVPVFALTGSEVVAISP